VRPDELHTFHRNARRGNLDVIMDSLQTNSQYRPIVVNVGTYTGRANEVLAGNHTLLAIRRLSELHPGDPRWNEVTVFWGDWDEHTCTKIVLADNRTAEVGGMDFAALKELLESIPDVSGTGYTDLDLTALGQSLNPEGLADLSSQFGEGDSQDTDSDGLTRLSLKLDSEVARRWGAHRRTYNDDTAALLALLSKVAVA
jgi:hypothetical protein